MEIENYFLVKHFCNSHNIQIELIDSLSEIGFIQIHQFENQNYISLESLPVLEKAIRLNQELSLEINELEVVLDLLNKIENLQEENKMLKLKLAMYGNVFSD
jgi:hypothetical protein